MGGNAFPNLPLRRVKREEIHATLQCVVDTLQYPLLTLPYVLDNLMGSSGRQESSGDLDLAINDHRATFHGEVDLPVFDLAGIAARAQEILPRGHVKTKTLKGGQVQTAFPIMGDPRNGLVQVDLIAGKADWLKFTHHSPGLDVSPYKGVMISTMLMVLAKMRRDLEILDSEGQMQALVGMRLGIEKGLSRQWMVRLDGDQHLRAVRANEFETLVQHPVRFARLRDLNDPEEVLRILLGQEVHREEVDTFEKMVGKMREVMPERMAEARDLFLEMYRRSSARGIGLEEVAQLSLWNP
jgi:hypothetical protein